MLLKETAPPHTWVYLFMGDQIEKGAKSRDLCEY